METVCKRPTSDDVPWPRPVHAWWVVGVLLIAYTVSFVDRMILTLLIPSIKAAFQVSDTQVSLLVGFSFAVFYTFMGLPLGALADRGNRKLLITWGITVWSLMTALCGLAAGYRSLFLARIGVGVGEATLSPAAYSLLSDYFPKHKLGRAIAVYSIGVPLGSGVALVIGGLVVRFVSELPAVALPALGSVEPWRLTFLLVGLPGLLVALLMLTVREPVRRGEVDASRPRWTDLARFIESRLHAVGAHFVGLSLLTFVIYGYMAWIPTFFARTYGLVPADVGLFYGAITAIGGALGLIIGGALADRRFRIGQKDGHLRVVRWSALGAAPFLIAMPFAPTAGLAAALLTPGILIASMHGGVAGAALQLIAPNRLRGQITAAYFFVANLIGLGLGPTAIAVTTDYVFGDDAALRYSLAVVATVALPLSAIVLTLGFGAFRSAVDANPVR
ncbi:MAG: spinster family MFS transporter [Gammaproteobacteria bacterium]